MISTILFDLDGTLLPIDFDDYLAKYLSALGRRLARVIAPDTVRPVLTSATLEMVNNNDPDITLSTAFWKAVTRAAGGTSTELRARIGEDEFLREDVAALRGDLTVPADSRKIVETAIESGYEVALATNPVFPREVIAERMRWAGLTGLPWRLITSYEDMHFAKPNPRFYTEVLQRIGRQPAECVMIGNDTRDDLVATTIGVKTFLLEGRIVHREDALVPTWQGTLENFHQLVRQRFAAAV